MAYDYQDLHEALLDHNVSDRSEHEFLMSYKTFTSLQDIANPDGEMVCDLKNRRLLNVSVRIDESIPDHEIRLESLDRFDVTIILEE